MSIGKKQDARILLTLLIAAAASMTAMAQETTTPTVHFGGCGGVYLLAEPGEFWVEVEKCDLNNSGKPTFLRAILVGPDRRVIEEQTLPDDGQAKGSGLGPVQRVRMSAKVAHKGIYGLNITVSNDRYGEDIAWGVVTNCPKYLVETSRGHRDARHEEPLVLLSPELPGDICFMPPRQSFAMEITEAPSETGPLTLYDAESKQIGELRVSEKGEVSGQFDGSGSKGPWRLHLPRFKGTVKIDGVTRWSGDEGTANLSLWTPQPNSWFPFAKYRWLLTPYYRLAYGQPGEEGSLVFQVHNNGAGETSVKLTLEFPDGGAWPVELPTGEVTLKPGVGADVVLNYRIPGDGDAWACRLRATSANDPSFSTYSTIELRRGVAPATQPLILPIVLKPYCHENEQFGYLPEYPLTNEVYFDLKNRPVVSSSKGLSAVHDGKWTCVESSKEFDGQDAGFRLSSSKVAFDQKGGLYLVGEQANSPCMLCSEDGGKSFVSYPIPGNGGFDIEQFSGHNVPEGPPPLARFTLTEKDPKLIWRRLNDLSLVLPRRESDGRLSFGEPILVSKKCIGHSAHSGIPSSIVSMGSKVHLIWAEATDPEESVPGVPTYAATFDRDTATLSAPSLIGYGPPANDVHNTPCITMDSKGYLHVLIGTHGRTFKYSRSLEPNTAAAGWTEAEDVGPGLRQTYVGMVCGKDDVLHVVFRLWFEDMTYFPAGHYACLTYMSKRPGEPWSAPRPLVAPPFSEYSVFYHRLTIDREGRLFLSYDYWSTYWFYRTDHRGTRRALIMSSDEGATWKLADMKDLVP